jgi:hypothetical protein
MDKNVILQQLTKMEDVLIVHIGMDFSALVIRIHAHKELSGLVTIVRLCKRNAKLVCIGLVLFAFLFHHNVLPN